MANDNGFTVKPYPTEKSSSLLLTPYGADPAPGMSIEEKIIWAVTYAAAFERLRENLPGAPSIQNAIENACDAVTSMRESQEAIKEGWGEDSMHYIMLKEMCKADLYSLWHKEE